MIVSNEIYKAAQKEMIRTGIPASSQIAQYAVESSWGKRTPPGSNNPFGMKARIRNGKIIDDYVVAATDEKNFKGQANWRGPQPFRQFSSIAEAFTAHADLLLQPVYAKARAKLPDVDAFCDALTGVYATDPHYGETLKKIIHQSNLLQYDKV